MLLGPVGPSGKKISLPIPNPALAQQSIFLQLVHLDPKGFASSDGVVFSPIR